MIHEYLKLMEYEVRVKFNSYAYYLQKLPILRKKPLLSFKFLKGLFIAISPIFDLFNSLLKTLMATVFFGLICYFLNKWASPISLVKQEEGTFFAFFFSTMVLYSLFSLHGEGESIRMFDNYFRMSPARVYRIKMFFQGTIDFLGKLLVYSLGAKVLGFPYYYGGLSAIYLYLWTYITEALHLYTYDHKIRDIKSKGWIWFFILSYLFSLLLSLFIPFSVSSFLFSPFQILLFIGGLWGMVYIYRFTHISKILYELPFSEGDIQEGESMSKNLALEAAKLKDEDLEMAKRHLKKELRGYKLLNELFFQRHRRLIFKPFVIKSAIIASVSLVAYMAPVFFPKVTQAFNNTEDTMDAIANMLPIFSYLAFNQDTLTRTIFINCDQALLQYGFYRRGEDLLEMFQLRLRKLLLWSSLPLMVIEGGIFFFLMQVGNLKVGAAYIFVLPLILWVFFCIHTLFTYYFFQPYTSDYKVKSPIVHIINVVIYVFCFQIAKFNLSAQTLLGFFFVACVLYSGLALILVYKKAPKRFVLKD